MTYIPLESKTKRNQHPKQIPLTPIQSGSAVPAGPRRRSRKPPPANCIATAGWAKVLAASFLLGVEAEQAAALSEGASSGTATRSSSAGGGAHHCIKKRRGSAQRSSARSGAVALNAVAQAAARRSASLERAEASRSGRTRTAGTGAAHPPGQLRCRLPQQPRGSAHALCSPATSPMPRVAALLGQPKSGAVADCVFFFCFRGVHVNFLPCYLLTMRPHLSERDQTAQITRSVLFAMRLEKLRCFLQWISDLMIFLQT